MVVRNTLPRSSIISTIAILVLSTVSSFLGLFREGHYNDPPALLPRLQAQDAVILVVAVPVLALGLRQAMRGSLRGRLIWLGALAFMTYIWASIAGQTAFNQFYLGYVVLFALSLFTLVSGLMRTDAESVRRHLEGQLRKPLYGGWLAFVAVGLSGLWLSDIIPAMLAGTTPLAVAQFGPQAAHTYVLDLGVVVPSLAIAAHWLWKGKRWGYVCVGVLLVMAAILAPSITAVTVVDLQGDIVTVTLPLLVASVVPPLVSAAFAVKYLLTLGGQQSNKCGTGERVVDA